MSFRGPLDLLVTETLCATTWSPWCARRSPTSDDTRPPNGLRCWWPPMPSGWSVEVLDDGKGLVEGVALSGLANLRARAETLGGTFSIAPTAGARVRLHWTAPIATIRILTNEAARATYRPSTREDQAMTLIDALLAIEIRRCPPSGGRRAGRLVAGEHVPHRRARST